MTTWRVSVDLDAEFADFVHRRGDHHLRTALLLTGDPHAAEDLVQAALVKLYRAWRRLDTTEDPDAYLRRILVNTQRSWWRGRGRGEAPAPDLAESAGPAEGEGPAGGGAGRRRAPVAPARPQRA